MNDQTFLEKLAEGGTPMVDATEKIALLGKKAAGAYLTKEADSLTNAVHQVVSDEEGLTPDHVRRVAEVANQAAWNELFVKGGDSAAEFEPADAGVVLKVSANRPETISSPSLDYILDPPGERLADDVNLKELLGVKDEAALPMFDGSSEASAHHEKVAGAVDVLRHSADRLNPELAESASKFYELVKQAHLVEGAGILQITQAVALVTGEDFAHTAMDAVAQQLRAEGAVQFSQAQELEKAAAAVVVDYEHPLLIEAVRFEKLAEAVHRIDTARADLAVQERESLDALRRSLAAS